MPLQKAAVCCIETDRWVGPALQVSPEDWLQCVGKVLITDTLGVGLNQEFTFTLSLRVSVLEQRLWHLSAV